MEVTAAQSISGCGPINTNPNSTVTVNLSLLPLNSVKKRCGRRSSAQSARVNPNDAVTVNLPFKPSKSVKRRCRCSSAQLALLNYRNFNRSDSPARLMQWTGGAWRSLTPEVLSVAKSAFSEGKAVVDVVIDGKCCVIDFNRMLLIDLGSGSQRSISWIDVNNECYFPRAFVDDDVGDDDDDDVDDDDDDENNLKIRIEVKLDSNNSCKRKLQEKEEVDTAGSMESGIGNIKRQRFGDMAISKGVNSRVLNDIAVVNGGKVRVLSEEDKSYAPVRDLFMTGMRNVDAGVRVSKIHQFVREGVGEKARFWKQIEMVKAARGKANVVFAWCGISHMGVREVLDSGFGPRSGVSSDLGHGVGVYFSPAGVSHQSDLLSETDDNGGKHVLLCRVILGNIEKVAAGSQQHHPSSANFDSGTNDLVNPKWYIVWSKNMNTHVLPEFVVSYKCSENHQGQQTKASELMDWIPIGSGSVVTNLFSKLVSRLPPSKVDVLRTLCMAFKARKIPKDKFLKQLKFVVGDEVLRSVISEILCVN